MVTDVPKVHVDAELNKVVDLLVSSAERRIVVVDTDGRVLGIITDGDLIKRASGTERTGLAGRPEPPVYQFRRGQPGRSDRGRGDDG